VTTSDWLSIAAIVVSVVALGVGQWRWRTERRERRAAIAAETVTREAERAADAEAREAERRDVAVALQLVTDPNPKSATRWWRLTLTGGTRHSRTTLSHLYVWNSATTQPATEPGEEGWYDVCAELGGGVSLFAGPAVHLRVNGGLAETAPSVIVDVAWNTGPAWRSMRRRIHVEPWG
jgi:hypothetical protein